MLSLVISSFVFVVFVSGVSIVVVIYVVDCLLFGLLCL